MEKYYVIIFEPEFEYHEFIRYIDLIDYLINFKDKLANCNAKVIVGKEL